jgi:hypothetical protein
VENTQALGGGIFVAILGAMFFPSIIAIIRGARKNHLGGILVLNLLSIAATIGASALAALLGAAVLPLSGFVLFALTAWAFAAPGRVEDRERRQRHQELLAALQAKPERTLTPVAPIADPSALHARTAGGWR